jgi:chemotaxis protein histidine kinase CheA
MTKTEDGVEFITPPNNLKAKLGNRLAGFDSGAIARAEAALKAMSNQFGDWIVEELGRLEAAHKALSSLNCGEAELEEFYRRAHDLKGLGTTYGYPIVSQFAASLCKLIDSPEGRAKAPRQILDAHVGAIVAAVRQKITTADHPIGKALLDELMAQVARYASAA